MGSASNLAGRTVMLNEVIMPGNVRKQLLMEKPELASIATAVTFERPASEHMTALARTIFEDQRLFRTLNDLVL